MTIVIVYDTYAEVQKHRLIRLAPELLLSFVVLLHCKDASIGTRHETHHVPSHVQQIWQKLWPDDQIHIQNVFLGEFGHMSQSQRG